ncbi:MAG TPA: hypothetical protein VFV67_09425 [Actinophytocola sp.]|uniref:hypothetical protein n=1 Tax=Actinophytocola sp. TaxID=1872138 RepID=UPI002DB8FD6B|nr:hypothetical protein [Actinophytocola sp.]HEU5470861.1 hypothetical protein [Actinophytocola sp.]
MNKLRRNCISVGLAAAALTVAGLAAGTSAAAESGPDNGKTDQAKSGGSHCTLSVKTRATQCFDTFREAIAQATAGRVTDANLSGLASVDGKTAAELNEGGFGTASVVHGIQYYWENFNNHPPPLHTLTVSGTAPCTTPTETEYVLAPLPILSINWNNNIRSFQGFNHCWQRMWDHPECSGLLWDYSANSADLGAARDRTECIIFS